MLGTQPDNQSERNHWLDSTQQRPGDRLAIHPAYDNTSSLFTIAQCFINAMVMTYDTSFLRASMNGAARAAFLACGAIDAFFRVDDAVTAAFCSRDRARGAGVDARRTSGAFFSFNDVGHDG